MARSFPLNDRPLAKTTTDLGRFQKAEGLRGMDTNLSESIQSAGRAPQINARSFVLADQSRGAVGEAIQQQGQMVMQMVLKQNEAINIIKENEAALAMDEERKAIYADIEKEPDETKWASIADRRAKALEARLLKEPLSPVARQQVEARFNSWKNLTSGEMVRVSADRTFKKVGLQGEATAIRQVDAGDFDGARDTARSLHEAGYISEPEKARMEINIQKQAEQNLVRDTYGIALANPEAILSDPEGSLAHIKDPQDRDRILTQARQEKSQRASDMADQFSDRLSSGEFQTMSDLKAAIPPGMNPTIQKQFEGIFMRAQQPGIKAKMEADAPQNYARFSDAVDKYDAKADPDGVRYAQLVMTVKQTMPEELRGEILGPLYRKRPGADSNIEPPEPLKATVKDIVGTMFDAQAFGVFKELAPKLSQYEADKWKEDPQKKAAAFARKGSAMIYMNKWMAENPEATPDKALETVRSFLSGSAPSVRSTSIRATPPDMSRQTPQIIPALDGGDLPIWDENSINEPSILIPQPIPSE